MDPLQELEKATRALDGLRDHISGAIDNAPDDATEQQLRQLSQHIEQGQSQLMAESRKVVAAARQNLESAKQAAQEAQQKLDEAQQRLAAEANKPALPPKKPEAPIDPDLGKTLRAELLERFGKHQRPREGTGLSEGKIWEEWDGLRP